MATVDAAEVMADMDRWIGPATKDLIENQLPRCWSLPFAQKFTIPSTSLGANNIVRLFKFPAGAYIWGWRSTPSDMDTDATPALTYSILAIDNADATKVTLVSASTNGQAAAESDSLLAAAYGKYVGTYWCAFKVGTAADVAAAGTLKCAWEMSIGVINRSGRKSFMGDAEV